MSEVIHDEDLDDDVIEPLMVGELVDGEDVEVSSVIEQLKRHAAEATGDETAPIFAGTFAMYAMADGGMMMVTDTPIGPIQGVNRLRMPPAMVRMIEGFAMGGKRGAFRAFMGGRGRKQIGQ